MGFVSILGHKNVEPLMLKESGMPTSFVDLNLDTALTEIAAYYKEYEVKKYFYILPKQIPDIWYRQSALRDLERPEIFEIFHCFTEEFRRGRMLYDNAMATSYELQKECFIMDGAMAYCTSVLKLRDHLQQAKPKYEAVSDLLRWLFEYTKGEEFVHLYEDTKEISKRLHDVSFVIEFNGKKMEIWEEREEEGSWGEGINELLHKEGTAYDFLPNPYGGRNELSPLERSVLDVLKKTHKEVFEKFHSYYETHHVFFHKTLLDLEQEVPFLLSFLRYRKRLEEGGFVMSYPEIVEDGLSVVSAYDIVLARKNMTEGKMVVGNDLTYEEGEQFFVITGPNQGGKTTFARAIGQVVTFAMLGLMVPASKAKVGFYYDIVTHFATEESVETGAGKLKEELLRLVPIMKKQYGKSFVLINELFTTATTYDAHIMGNRVMEHFMRKGCQGIYVTHIQELANEQEGVVSLVASVDEKNSNIRTYKMCRKSPEGLGFASDIVKRYGLTYEELKERLGMGGGAK